MMRQADFPLEYLIPTHHCLNPASAYFNKYIIYLIDHFPNLRKHYKTSFVSPGASTYTNYVRPKPIMHYSRKAEGSLWDQM